MGGEGRRCAREERALAQPVKSSREVFGQRAAFYTHSPAHTDERTLTHLVELAAPGREWRALDLGAGSGHTAFAFALHVASVMAADVTPEMLAEARRLRDERRVRNVRFCLADAAALPFSAASFDLVTCRRAAHHFPDLPGALAEVHRLLRSGGVFAVDDRSVPEDDFVDVTMNALDRCHDESHVREYRPSEWRAMLERAGLALRQVEPYVRHRPLSSLTEGASADNVAAIIALLARLTPEARALLNLTEVGGELHINHWYLMLVADKV